jgi:hypothetical protein
MTTLQRLTFELDGMTAGDYLAHVRDPDPPGLGTALRSVTIDADPLGATIEIVLVWNGGAPDPATAARLSGLPTGPEVTAVHRRPLGAVAA